MAQEFLPTAGGNIYPDPDTDYDQSEAFRRVALNRDVVDSALVSTAVTSASMDATTKANAAREAAVSLASIEATTKANQAKTDAISDATTKYGGLPKRVTDVETKNDTQDSRLDDLESLRAVKCVRLEAGAWVWDTVAGTHYVIPDADGSLIVRATPWPVPNPTTPELIW